MVGSPINLRSPDYYSNINEHSIVKELDAWSDGGTDGDPTIRITGSGTMRFGIEFVVTFDADVAPGIPEEERALIAAFIGWTQSPDYERMAECYQHEFVQAVIFDKFERIGCSYEDLLQTSQEILESGLPFDNAVVTFRVMDYRSDETDPETQQSRSFLELDLEEFGLDPGKIERYFRFTLADEPVVAYDGVFRTDPTDPEIPDRTNISVYRYDGVWYFDPRTFSDDLLDLANPRYKDGYLATSDGEGDVVWVNGSYCRVTTGAEDMVLHVNDPAMLAGIAAGDRIDFSYYANFTVEDCTLLIEEHDLVSVSNASLIEKR